MEGFTSTGLGVMLIGFTILSWVVYHKIFTVYYFDKARGCMTELIGCLIAGVFLTAISIYLWWLTAIIIVIICFMSSKKVSSGFGKIVIWALGIIVIIFVFSAQNAAKQNNANQNISTVSMINNQTTLAAEANPTYNASSFTDSTIEKKS